MYFNTHPSILIYSAIRIAGDVQYIYIRVPRVTFFPDEVHSLCCQPAAASLLWSHVVRTAVVPTSLASMQILDLGSSCVLFSRFDMIYVFIWIDLLATNAPPRYSVFAVNP